MSYFALPVAAFSDAALKVGIKDENAPLIDGLSTCYKVTNASEHVAHSNGVATAVYTQHCLPSDRRALQLAAMIGQRQGVSRVIEGNVRQVHAVKCLRVTGRGGLAIRNQFVSSRPCTHAAARAVRSTACRRAPARIRCELNGDDGLTVGGKHGITWATLWTWDPVA